LVLLKAVAAFERTKVGATSLFVGTYDHVRADT
jgi:hypothetical protein